jgi:hypothetical protein
LGCGPSGRALSVLEALNLHFTKDQGELMEGSKDSTLRTAVLLASELLIVLVHHEYAHTSKFLLFFETRSFYVFLNIG